MPQSLEEIQRLQFADRAAANTALRDLLNSYLPFAIAAVTVRPLAVSLNSINGLLDTEDGRRFFFKTHVEPQGIINEYYNATALAEAGYPVLRPVHSSTEAGRQILLYEVVETPSLFDVLYRLEQAPQPDDAAFTARLLELQAAFDQHLSAIYRETLAALPATQHATAPVHQLFAHRLTGGRFASFYVGQDIGLPGQVVRYETLAGLRWTINGAPYPDTLADLVARATERLNPARGDLPGAPAAVASIVGHGDAHNGNIFVDEQQGRLTYFDPAFAGRHAPLLDLAKPLFHNIFAIWMYYPQEVAHTLDIALELTADRITVTHSFAPSTVRLGLLRSKVANVLAPLLRDLQARQMLAADWRSYLKLALLCCPLLTMNLADGQRFPPAISLLGLALVVEMGSESPASARSILDTALDEAAAAIG